MGDRICVMKLGEIMQVDTPTELYNNPVNMFVAGFIGAPEMNLLDVELVDEAGQMFVSLGEQRLALPEAKAAAVRANGYDKPVFGIRPDNITLSLADDENVQTIVGDVVRMENMGHEVFVYFRAGDKELTARVPVDDVREKLDMQLQKGVKFAVEMGKVHVFDKKTEKNISLQK